MFLSQLGVSSFGFQVSSYKFHALRFKLNLSGLEMLGTTLNYFEPC